MTERRTDLPLNEFGRQRQGLNREEINLAYQGVLSELARAEAEMAQGPNDNRFDDEVYHFANHLEGMKTFAEIALGLDHQYYGQRLIQIGRKSLDSDPKRTEAAQQSPGLNIELLSNGGI